MNDGDFPRRAQQADFDLLALPGMARPGDRSRRDDDRYLMLEALLAARDKLYVSWVGRNVRDNSEQPASVLVSQLRDYLQAGWELDVDKLTTVHALQPFSRVYFEGGDLFTYAGEWRAAHAAQNGEGEGALPPYELEPDYSLKLTELAQFVRQPARHFFRRRLGVTFAAEDVVGEDEEPFALDGLQRYTLEDRLLDDAGHPEPDDDVRATLTARAEGLGRQGLLPIGLVGRQWQVELVDDLVPVRSAWLDLVGRYPEAASKLAVNLDFAGVRLDDWIDRLRSGATDTAWLMQISSKVLDKKGAPRGDKLIGTWLRQLAAAASGMPVTGYLVSRDALVTMRPLEQESARAQLAALVQLWRRNLDQPLPVACKSALAQLLDGDPRAAYDGGFERPGEVEQEQCLARLWPDFASLCAAGDWAGLVEQVYGPLVEWMTQDIAIRMHVEDQA
jgi:exodeoxyribonuclease V gamma subunit